MTNAHPARGCAVSRRTAEVWLADPGRAYLPNTGTTLLATYDVPTTLELEDRNLRQTRLLRLHPA